MASPIKSLPKDHTFTHSLKESKPEVKRGKGNYLYMEDGRRVFDACGGAAVTCLGYGNERVIEAKHEFEKEGGIFYLASAQWTHPKVKELSTELVKSTDYKMEGVYYTSSGSDAIEAAMKYCRQYFVEKKEPKRVKFIGRKGSYHGNTLGALSISGYPARQKPYLPILMGNVYHVSSCYPYRDQEGLSDSEFVSKKVQELENIFLELGPSTVAAFIVEPVSGGALGCVTSTPGYLKAMKDLCHKYGALIVFDEIMCGSGRTGYIHAWQFEDVVPDLQTIGKSLTGGYAAMSAVLLSSRVYQVFSEGSQERIHGLTYDAMPSDAVAALEVQKIIKEKNLMSNVREQGELLGKMLKETFAVSPYVGDIRGRGLFWAMEFVKNKDTKEAFPKEKNIANDIVSLALEKYNIILYSGPSSDGVRGDVIIISPSYTITGEDVISIVQAISFAVNSYFSEIYPGF